MAKRIVLITAGHLTSCPRLLKEAKLFSEYGYHISIVYLNSLPSVSLIDNEVIKSNSNKWHFYEIKWKSTFNSFFSIFFYKISRLLKIDNDMIQTTSKVIKDKVMSIKADLYVAHSPVVLPAAALAAKKYNSKFIYDIEDAFPFIDDNRFLENPDYKTLNIEKKYINLAAFTITASPLYSELYRNLYNLNKSPITLLNAFNINYKGIEVYKDRVDLSKVSLYWYSQTVGLNRGLQDLFKSINLLPINTFELHIRGIVSESIKEELLLIVENKESINSIFFHEIADVSELELRNKEHDIGFAIESGSSLNREYCITNKILDYLRSGLMIAATKTAGNNIITDDLGELCITYNSGDYLALAKSIVNVINNPDLLKKSKNMSLTLSENKYNWTNQSRDYLEAITNELH